MIRAAICAGIVIAAIAVWVVLTTRAEPITSVRPSSDTLYGLQSEGIYVAYADPGPRCVYVSVLNPSPSNIALLKRRFGNGVCVDRRPGAIPDACVGSPPLTSLDSGPVKVPQLLGLGLGQMRERITRAGLTVLNPCWIPLSPVPGSLDARLRVVGQCPAAGQHVARGTLVGFQMRARLSGGFNYSVDSGDEIGRCGRGTGFMSRAQLRRRLHR